MLDIASDIIKQCQAGQTAAYAQVVEHYERPMFAYVARLRCTPPGRCYEDVVQEIFVKAYTSLHRYLPQETGSFTNWLFAIARNHCISLGRRKQLEERFRDSEKVASPLAHTDDAQSPLAQVHQQEELDRITVAVDQLSEAQRSAFVLRYYADLKFNDIAQILDCTVQTARTRVTRAKQSLIQTLLPDTEQIENMAE